MKLVETIELTIRGKQYLVDYEISVTALRVEPEPGSKDRQDIERTIELDARRWLGSGAADE